MIGVWVNESNAMKYSYTSFGSPLDEINNPNFKNLTIPYSISSSFLFSKNSYLFSKVRKLNLISLEPHLKYK